MPPRSRGRYGSRPERRLNAPAGSSVPIQLVVEDAEVPESWLLEPDLREQAEHVDRLAADLELLNDLALATPSIGWSADNLDALTASAQVAAG